MVVNIIILNPKEIEIGYHRWALMALCKTSDFNSYEFYENESFP